MPTTVDKLAIAAQLREIAALLELKGENRFRARAFERGARAVEQLKERVTALVKSGRLTEKPGIGDALAKQIVEIHTTGKSSYLDRLRAELPPGVLELSRVPHLTLPRIRKLHDALGISSLAELAAAVEAGRVREVPGFGKKTEDRIREGIEVATGAREDERAEREIILVDALAAAEPLVGLLEPLGRVVVAGGVRRSLETMDALDVVVAAKAPEAVVRRVLRWSSCGRTITRGEGFLEAWLVGGPRLRLSAVKPPAFGAALVRATGSEAHVAALVARAAERGVPLAGRTEEALYAGLGLAWVPPELRDGAGELATAARGDGAFDDLLAEGDVRGLVHCHTVWSDGRDDVEAMARAAEALGMRYITITDHSPSAFYANGVGLDRLERQWDAIAAAQEKVPGVRILRGTESDILDSGALDYPDAVLEKLDVVIASVHSRMKMDEDTMTRRLVAAMRQPVFKIWGHALGRLLLRRAPFACRVEEVLDAAAGARAAIEINGDPYRLDMEPRWLRAARERGVRFVVSTDAHSTRSLANYRFGVGLARRAGVTRGEVLNTADAATFARAVKPAA